METTVVTERLPFLDALIRWGNLDLIENIRVEERRHTIGDLTRSGILRLVPDDECLAPTRDDWMKGPIDFELLYAAWRTAMGDFQQRIERGEIHLNGVPFTGDSHGTRQAISGTLAAKMKFDLRSNTLTIGKREFVAVAVSVEPFGKRGQSLKGMASDTRIGEVVSDEENRHRHERHGEQRAGQNVAGSADAFEAGKRGRGRPKFPFEQLAVAAQNVRREGQNSVVAGNLAKEFARIYPDERPLKIETVMRHVRTIYGMAGKLSTA